MKCLIHWPITCSDFGRYGEKTVGGEWCALDISLKCVVRLVPQWYKVMAAREESGNDSFSGFPGA